LNTGAQIPAVAFGTGAFGEKRAGFKQLLLSALKAGYRHLDGAWLYQTEGLVGEGIRESGIPRQEIFLTTKLPWHHVGRVQEYFDDSLKSLGVDYVDLYLMHCPQSLAHYDTAETPFPKKWETVEHPNFNEAWAEMEKIFASGKAKAIGVSNFSIKNLEKLLTTAKVVPAVNQIETHPYLVQRDLLDYSKEKGIHITAYSATGRNTNGDPVLDEIAAKYNVSPVQVIFAWDVARGVSIATQSSNEERRKEALNLPKLEQSDLDKIDALDKNQFAYYQLDGNGTIFGWTPEQLGWEGIKLAEKGFW